MKIAYLHASKYGNGASVAEEFKRQMERNDVEVEIHHIGDAKPKELPRADLYLFSSPGRMGKPIGSMRRFLKKVQLPEGTPYALLATAVTPRPDKKTGRMPTEEEQAKWQQVMPAMTDLLDAKGLRKVGQEQVMVMEIKGPLEDGWQAKVAAFAESLLQAR